MSTSEPQFISLGRKLIESQQPLQMILAMPQSLTKGRREQPRNSDLRPRRPMPDPGQQSFG